MALQSRSISAVFPDPTGPPMPMRSGPFVLDMFDARSATMSSRLSPGRRTEMHGAALILSRAKQSRILRLVPHAGKIGAKGRAAEIVERCIQRALSSCDDDRLEQGQHALAVGLSQRNEPRAGGNPVRRQRVQERVHRGREGYGMRG